MKLQKTEAMYMERYSSRTIDELGRLVLHGELRKLLGLETGDKVSLTLVDSIVILQKSDDDSKLNSVVCQVSDLGMIDIPREARQRLGWDTKDKIALYHTGNIIILKSAEKADAA